MQRLKHNISLRFVKLADGVLITSAFALCWFGYYSSRIISPFYSLGNWLVVFLFLIIYMYLAKIYDGLQITLHRISEMIYSQALAFFITDGILYVVICLLSKRAVNLWPGIGCIAIQLLASAIWGVAAHNWYFHTFSSKKSVVVYETREGFESLVSEYGLSKKFDVQLSMSVYECIENLEVLNGFDTVFLSGVHSHDRNIILKHCVENDLDMYIIPRIGDIIMSGAKRMHMFHLPILRIGRYSPSPEYIIIKRVFDIIASGVACILLSPVMLVTAIAIKACDGGPVLYRQCRLTTDGHEFELLKFRSMRVDAEKNGAQLSTGTNDERVTPVGRIIRKVRADEIPQLINILRGDMSIVGPRPERPEIAAVYEAELPEFRLRLQAKAGLTGYAQVYGKYNTTPYDKLMMDLMYIARPSLIEDFKIIMATVKILFMPDSTEGIAEGSKTALSEDRTEVNV